MPSYNSTARRPFASGGKVGSKKPKVKRIILWKGKAKDWPGAKEAARQTRNRKAEGGWITKKKKTNPWITKKKRTDDAGETRPPNKWIQKKKKWITKKEKPKAWITKKKKQGYKDREDESLGMRTGKESGKKQSFKDRRDESYGKWGKRPNQRINRAKGGKADKNWIQGVNKSIKKRGTKGVCTGKKFGSASCKPGSRRYNLAKTFKKMARAKHASGGLVRYI